MPRHAGHTRNKARSFSTSSLAPLSQMCAVTNDDMQARQLRNQPPPPGNKVDCWPLRHRTGATAATRPPQSQHCCWGKGAMSRLAACVRWQRTKSCLICSHHSNGCSRLCRRAEGAAQLIPTTWCAAPARAHERNGQDVGSGYREGRADVGLVAWPGRAGGRRRSRSAGPRN